MILRIVPVWNADKGTRPKGATMDYFDNLMFNGQIRATHDASGYTVYRLASGVWELVGDGMGEEEYYDTMDGLGDEMSAHRHSRSADDYDYDTLEIGTA